jgi:molybdopterin/thiamine biosynthesis adenylyltransferase/rhodanese-related sulfurtransferase
VKPRVTEITLEELKRRIEAHHATAGQTAHHAPAHDAHEAHDSLIVLDVREPAELRSGMIAGARSLPHGSVARSAATVLPEKDAEIVTYCASGARSRLAAETLASLGYTRVATANPGFVRWSALGYPTESVGPSLLTPLQRERYSRHLLLSEVGEEGQATLLRSKVLVLGAGGLGSPAALYLAAAGVGTLGLLDSDAVELSNLQRQILHTTNAVGTPKVESAERTLRALDPSLAVVLHRERLTRQNVERIFTDYDVIVDGTDNFPTRYLVNDASVWLGKPVVHGSIFRFDGQLTTLVPDRAAATLGVAAGPCYRCLYPAPPPPHLAPNCQEAGVIGVLPGVVGVLQATEALKLLLRCGAPLVGRLLVYDALRLTFRELKIPRAPDCAVCGREPTLRSYTDYDDFCARPR